MERYRQQKETEQKVHENLYNNLYLLSAFYPTTKEFDAVFHKDMFVKNNKMAFFQVSHYLLNTLNPELTRQKLTSWPLCEIKQEVKFRSEIISYINELNLTYKNADIPACQASSVISPGGIRFAKYMLKISQLVLYEHLRKSDQFFQYNLKPHKNLPVVTKAQLSHLKKETFLAESETNELLQTFKKHHDEMIDKAEKLTNKLSEVNGAIQKAKTELIETEKEFNLQYPSYPPVSSLEERLFALKVQIEKILELKELFNSSKKLLLQISGSNWTLEHNENNFVVPNEIRHIITNKNELSLIEYFKGLSVLLERKALELRGPTNIFIDQIMQSINVESSKYEIILKQLQFQQDHISNSFEELGILFNEVLIKNDDTALAFPLQF